MPYCLATIRAVAALPDSVAALPLDSVAEGLSEAPPADEDAVADGVELALALPLALPDTEACVESLALRVPH